MMLPNLNVNEILHRIKHQLPWTDYKHEAVKALILSIDSIELSDNTIKSRTSKIIEAHRGLRQELRQLHSSQKLRSRSQSVSSEFNWIISTGSDDFHTRSAQPQYWPKEHLLIPGGGLKSYASAGGGCRFEPIPGYQSSALETLRMIEYQRSLEQRPKQKFPSRDQHAIPREHRYRSIQVHQRQTMSKTGHSDSHRSRPHSNVIKDHGLSKTGTASTRNHPQRVVYSSTSTKRRPEQSSPTLPAKRPRPRRGAYSIKILRGSDDGSDLSTDEIECSDGSEYCDDDA